MLREESTPAAAAIITATRQSISRMQSSIISVNSWHAPRTANNNDFGRGGEKVKRQQKRDSPLGELYPHFARADLLRATNRAISLEQ